MEPGAHGPGRDAECVADLIEGQSEVVVQDDHRSLIGIEVAEATFDLIAIGELGCRIRSPCASTSTIAISIAQRRLPRRASL